MISWNEFQSADCDLNGKRFGLSASYTKRDLDNLEYAVQIERKRITFFSSSKSPKVAAMHAKRVTELEWLLFMGCN